MHFSIIEVDSEVCVIESEEDRGTKEKKREKDRRTQRIANSDTQGKHGRMNSKNYYFLLKSHIPNPLNFL